MNSENINSSQRWICENELKVDGCPITGRPKPSDKLSKKEVGQVLLIRPKADKGVDVVKLSNTQAGIQHTKTLTCLIDESGSLMRNDRRPFRVGALCTTKYQYLSDDLRRLKRE